jgi:hypothetical protein
MSDWLCTSLNKPSIMLPRFLGLLLTCCTGAISSSEMLSGCYGDVFSSYLMLSLKSDSSCVASTAFSSVPTAEMDK